MSVGWVNPDIVLREELTRKYVYCVEVSVSEENGNVRDGTDDRGKWREAGQTTNCSPLDYLVEGGGISPLVKGPKKVERWS